MNEGSLFSNANMTSFMGKEIELLKYNFSGEDYKNIEVTATKSLKIVYRKLYKSLFIYLFICIKINYCFFLKRREKKKKKKKKRKKKWWHARLMRWDLERNK